MLRYKMRNLILSGVLLLSFSAVALADTVQGRVASVGMSTVDVTVYDAQGRPYANKLRLKTDTMTHYSGVSSAAKLQKNDPVAVEVSQQSSGSWHADKISKLKETGAIPATPTPPSPSLRGALGNPVVRGALLGAATGAIASSSSGGKAGKGALVGAGVGAAGGLLMEMFSQKPQPAQTDVYYQDDTRN